MPEKELLSLQEEGHNLAKSLQCPYLDVSRPQDGPQNGNDEQALTKSQFAPDKMEEALRYSCIHKFTHITRDVHAALHT